MSHVVYREKCACQEVSRKAEIDQYGRVEFTKRFCWKCKQECMVQIHEDDNPERGAEG